MSTQKIYLILLLAVPLIFTSCDGGNSTTSDSAKVITAFNFALPPATGIISESTHTIDIVVPFGTDVTSLAPAITHTGASISPVSGASYDFTGSRIFTVTAADSSTQNYTVTVTRESWNDSTLEGSWGTDFNFNTDLGVWKKVIITISGSTNTYREELAYIDSGIVTLLCRNITISTIVTGDDIPGVSGGKVISGTQVSNALTPLSDDGVTWLINNSEIDDWEKDVSKDIAGLEFWPGYYVDSNGSTKNLFYTNGDGKLYLGGFELVKL